MAETTRLVPCACLHCGKFNDAATSPDGHTPSSGDISICLHCGHVSAFSDDMSFRQLNDAEMIELAGNETILNMQKARGYIAEDLCQYKNENKRPG